MLPDPILWTHALAALFFGTLALWAYRGRDAYGGLPRAALTAALATTALWALAVAGLGSTMPVAYLFEGVRDIAWLTLMAVALGREGAGRSLTPVLAYAVVVAVVVVRVLLYLLADSVADQGLSADLNTGAALLGALAAVASLVLAHALYPALPTPAARLTLAAVGAMWLVDVNLATVRYLSGAPIRDLHGVRGAAMILVAGGLALALHRAATRPVQVSRTVAVRSLSLLALGIYLVAMVGVTGAIAGIGGRHARALQTAFVFGSAAAALTLASSGWARAWIKVKLAKHLFTHRYDYRAEWTRFTGTLGQPDGAAPLEERVVKAVADLTDSPAGLLLVADRDGLAVAATWRWDAPSVDPGEAAPLAAHLAATGRIIELAALRAGAGDAADRAAVPAWMLGLADAWILVPLPHVDRLAGAILLARPPVDRALDWEDFDLLRIVGRQAASYLGEARAQSALAEARRFEEFNRRFAFILHDVKNLVSQLTLVARNAERHADNPAFRADMVATLNESATRMNDLLARLSRHGPVRRETPLPVDLLAVATRAAQRRQAQHPVRAEGTAAVALADPAQLDQLLGHLIQNAIEASGTGVPVVLSASATADRAILDIVDTGCGMAPGFVRDQLFRPFASTKPTGFGIGAFEALQLARAMDGDLAVDSQEGRGTRFRLTLPRAVAPALEAAA